MAKLYSSDFGEDNATYLFSELQPEELGQTLNKYFLNQGYRLEEGTLQRGCYGIGNAVLRILFGAFVKRYKFGFTISRDVDNMIRLDFRKAMSGALGGVIGYQKMSNEYKRITKDLKNLFI